MSKTTLFGQLLKAKSRKYVIMISNYKEAIIQDVVHYNHIVLRPDK